VTDSEQTGAGAGGGHRREHQPPAQARERRSRAAEAQRHDEVPPPDTRPAVGTPASPAVWRRAAAGARVALHRRGWADARWSFLYERGGTGYVARAAPDLVAAAARRMRREISPPAELRGPFLLPPVWTWQVPLYFWFGGMAAGASFVAAGADLARDHRSARIARLVALGALMPSPPLLIADLGRPLRFFNMLRVFKPRSPMSMGSWCLSVFGGLLAAAVGADLLGRERAARALGAASAAAGTYLGSYTGVLLAGTAVPLWARSRAFLPPLFVCTATASGAAACRLTIAAAGERPEGHPTRTALATVETLAMIAELGLSAVNERRLGPLARALEEGRAGRLMRAAKWAVRAGLALRGTRLIGAAGGRGAADRAAGAADRAAVAAGHLSSLLFLLGGLAFRFAWLAAGKASAEDAEAIVATARRARPANGGDGAAASA
jgi:formate-dependent nitrite reductase membrane component NrfD